MQWLFGPIFSPYAEHGVTGACQQTWKSAFPFCFYMKLLVFFYAFSLSLNLKQILGKEKKKKDLQWLVEGAHYLSMSIWFKL